MTTHQHHLFPTINHTHYKDISPIVQQTCKEFNIPYSNHHSFLSALMDSAKTMKYFSSAPIMTRDEFFSQNS